MSKTNERSLALRDEIEAHVEAEYGAKPEHLWQEYPEHEIFRHEPRGSEKGKWFLLLANVTRKQLGLDDPTGEVIFVANVKCDPFKIDELVRENGFARGYHMSKKDWLSILLDGTVDMQTIESLVQQSFELTD